MTLQGLCLSGKTFWRTSGDRLCSLTPLCTEAAARRCSVKKVFLKISQIHRTKAATRGVLLRKLFLEISQNSQENTCTRVSFLKKVAGLRPATLLKKRLWHRCFLVNFGKFPIIPFLQNTSGRLLLIGKYLCQRPATLLKKRIWNRCFPINFAKFLSLPFLCNICSSWYRPWFYGLN